MKHTVTYVFREVPNKFYLPSQHFAWVTKKGANVFEDSKTLLAQLWTSQRQEDPDLWVEVPSVILQEEG